MNTQHITVLPNVDYTPEHIGNLKSDHMRCSEIIQYGYIKMRDLAKWIAGETVAVKMGMLSPCGSEYRGLTVIDCAVKRINEQDTTALFEDDDEPVPVYVFVSYETDNEWREFLQENGFFQSRHGKQREGIRIDKKSLFTIYGMHYGVETAESKSFREQEIYKEKKYRESYKAVNGSDYDKDKEKLKTVCGENNSINTCKNVEWTVVEDIERGKLYLMKTVRKAIYKTSDQISIWFAGIVAFCIHVFIWFKIFSGDWDAFLFFDGLFLGLANIVLLITIIGVICVTYCEDSSSITGYEYEHTFYDVGMNVVYVPKFYYETLNDVVYGNPVM